MPFLTANTDFSAEPALQALRDSGRIADSTVVTKGGQQIGIIGVTTPDVPEHLLARPNVKFLADVAGIVNAEAAAPDRGGRQQDHPVLAPAEHRATRRRWSRS